MNIGVNIWAIVTKFSGFIVWDTCIHVVTVMPVPAWDTDNLIGNILANVSKNLNQLYNFVGLLDQLHKYIYKKKEFLK